MRKLLLALSLALIAAACGGTGSEEPTNPTTAETQATAESTTTSGASSTETTPASATTAETETTAAPQPDGPPAPDFTLALADGSTFALTAAEKPIYMVFWAEW